MYFFVVRISDGPLAQSAEHGANNARVMSSSLIRTNLFLFFYFFYLLLVGLSVFVGFTFLIYAEVFASFPSLKLFCVHELFIK